MNKKKPKVEFRYYEMPNNEVVLALLGEDKWRIEYGIGIDFLHFHNFLEVGYCYEGTGAVILDDQSIRFEADVFMIIPPNFSHTTNSDKGVKGYWEWMYLDTEKCLNEIYKNDVVFVQKQLAKIHHKALFLYAKDHPVLVNIIQNIMREMRKKDLYYNEK